MSRKAVLALILLCLFTTSVGTPQREQTPSDSTTKSQKTKDLTIIRAVRGQNVVLPCQVHKDYPIAAVVWRRTDVKPEKVLLYQSKTSHQPNKYASSRSRVHLMDRGMNSGNLSLALQNVTLAETGTYECQAVDKGRHQWKTPIENTDTVNTLRLIIALEAQRLNAGKRRFAPRTSPLLFLTLGLYVIFRLLCLILLMV